MREKCVLICGWRPVWEEVPKRLLDRLLQITKTCQPGSVIIFINFVETEAFTSLMAKVDIRPFKGRDRNPLTEKPGSPPIVTKLFDMQQHAPGVTIKHILGDAATPECLGPVVTSP